ncbi:MAG TPA: hypothetical protein DCQ26_06235 [Marinilabiliales bacterium]|jgi:hypothetical protein|nr:MAG: hypothetical protein A2W95_04115 [Bacteroidetes bacterium GWA2_40_14]OFX58491.1 MAG: hypothetical protein A2W84_08650 [Bacteroidetes bacterium GWC2_40_13]OFX74113.1 MAG: hypothetical protein A2W96_12460 [Bacteroidetes bacterium GWD2_40_43]OFX93053.1 MAG: hypothetical protein A2W97_05615 [Bacteroidetes bacterium GWE2_40_63]OFY21423.1 MAG: hypothetical protein A2W88_09615 [Bacteroidetes bacterium GWF2_40_13]OFZ27417.1 MAG: hypothetical protein A2437_14090 [Bacteroidetes bacterium RIFOXYC
MKTNTVSKFLFGFVVLVAMASCQDTVTETYYVNTPVYMTYDELRTSFKSGEAQEIIQSGKIYFKDDYIYVNEFQKGIHIIDNSDPENPINMKFIDIPGNVDLAIKGNILYADSYVDLVSIDISDIENIVEVDRDTNIFPYIIPAYDDGIVEGIDQNQGVIIGYTVTERTYNVKDEGNYYNKFWYRGEIDVMYDGASGNPTSGSETSGTGGSMARFTLNQNYLYVVDNASLKLFNISQSDNPAFEKYIGIGWNIETIFPYQDKLFIGSQTGMYVYSIQNPANPQFLSEFRHASSCDPVVVNGNYAYVTLRGGNLCGAIESQLNVIDISTIENPKLVATCLMEEPYGLGIDDSVLFVCDGNAGLKIYNAANPLEIDSHLLASYPDNHAFDVIPLGDVLVMIGVDGLYQYDYSDLNNIRELSHIDIYGNQ